MGNIRTDLALEARELYQQQNRGHIPGVKVDEEEVEGVKISRVHIISPLGEESLGKPQGNYITLEAPDIKNRDPEFQETLSKLLAQEIGKLVSLNKKSVTLVVGLGNWNITPDSLGPKVVDRLLVTRHILEYMPDQVDDRLRPVCAVAPGVLGITGIETGEIIKGIVEKIRPDLVIAIDALASRRTDRIGVTIQIADTGISPGSGIGNKRMGLNKETLGVPTIAIGVPTVVYAYTIGRDSLQMLIDQFADQTSPGSQFYQMLKQMDEAQLDALVHQVVTQELGDLVVTPKEIDLLIGYVADVLADGLNLALHENMTIEDIKHFIN
ncbi:GPR endopeptidase [Caldicoprobacter faecalis]|uniref:Germination protease n=1 Tax=Caldicoprobacter faecalis TaxID=937334 RepID=A0A1I5T973_9FIRM|nr:GPR endopeptidase [Caldicoprobacter faecalis]SFP79595.1 spore protease [Caldicoprobacter faecalis]